MRGYLNRSFVCGSHKANYIETKKADFDGKAIYQRWFKIEVYVRHSETRMESILKNFRNLEIDFFLFKVFFTLLN